VKAKILLVDDEETLLDHMRQALNGDYEVLTGRNEEEALSVFQREKPPVVVLDLSLLPRDPSDLGGMRLLEQILAREPTTRVIMVTADTRDANALRAVSLGAWDFYNKPVRLDELKVMIRRALHIHHLQRRLQQADVNYGALIHGIVGQSPRMREIFSFIERVAASDVDVLISGESGTGKEVVARAIHRQSSLSARPFVVVNCGAIPESLLEIELFRQEEEEEEKEEEESHAGARAAKRGKFEAARGGTIFFDEIGELTPALQVKLLRFLQDRKAERLGGVKAAALDVRIIAATNRDLKREVEDGDFREDLYYLMAAAPVELPPLRNRREDILPLARFFLHKHCLKHRKPAAAFSPDAEAALLAHAWPDNVRELENVVGRAAVLSPRAVLLPADLGLAPENSGADVNLKFARQAMELDFVKKALTKNKGVVSRAARELGISRVNLYDLMQKHSINIEEFKARRPGRPSKSALNRREVV
jgi:two-component system, NtrC family, response regulator